MKKSWKGKVSWEFTKKTVWRTHKLSTPCQHFALSYVSRQIRELNSQCESQIFQWLSGNSSLVVVALSSSHLFFCVLSLLIARHFRKLKIHTHCAALYAHVEEITQIAFECWLEFHHFFAVFSLPSQPASNWIPRRFERTKSRLLIATQVFFILFIISRAFAALSIKDPRRRYDLVEGDGRKFQCQCQAANWISQIFSNKSALVATVKMRVCWSVWRWPKHHSVEIQR